MPRKMATVDHIERVETTSGSTEYHIFDKQWGETNRIRVAVTGKRESELEFMEAHRPEPDFDEENWIEKMNERRERFDRAYLDYEARVIDNLNQRLQRRTQRRTP